MAEYVNQRLEEMIPELEEMSSIGLFSIKETKVILKLREAHEYKLRQQTKTKQSFLNYIEYEKKLLELIKIRRKKLGQDSKKRDVEKAIADRIHKLYRLVCERFSDDLHLWEQHIEFTKLMNEKSYVSRLYTKVLKIHSHNEDLWVRSARWESSKEGNMNPDLAREILLKAQRVNPESQLIFLEMFRMELDLAKIAVKRKQILGLADKKDDTSDDDCSQINIGQELKIANIIYSKGIEIFPGNSELHLKMLAVCCAVKEAKALRQQIVQDLQCLYPENPQVWHALALINLNGLRKMDKANQRESAKQCVEVYQQAVEKLPNGEYIFKSFFIFSPFVSSTKSSKCCALETETLKCFKLH
ncbi:U3 small nucleolar RNA-associated protein 6 [Biomphalaria glabrata]|nr:U3 small nucleolar RNA-associated protein 6 [Biomphalaria glabrata]